MLAMNIRKSKSPWGSPVILVRKPPENGKPIPPRFVVDYRQLNSVTLTDGYPVPSVSYILDAISEGKFYSRLNLARGYWQVNLHTKNRMKSAFCYEVPFPPIFSCSLFYKMVLISLNIIP